VSSVAEEPKKTIRSTIPAQLDRLNWTPFHTRTKEDPEAPEGGLLPAPAG
jgi:hypothetical protein